MNMVANEIHLVIVYLSERGCNSRYIHVLLDGSYIALEMFQYRPLTSMCNYNRKRCVYPNV